MLKAFETAPGNPTGAVDERDGECTHPDTQNIGHRHRSIPAACEHDPLRPQVAERLGVAQLTALRTLSVSEATVSGERVTDDGYVDVETTLPAVVSVNEQIAEARYPSFKGIMSAKKKPVEVLTIGDLGLASGDTGAANSWSVVHEVTARPPRTGGTIITDDGTAATQLADYLAAAKLI